MNREIKFRAWDDKDKVWLLGYELPNLGGFSMFGEVMLFQEWSDVINRFILQQKDRKESDLKLMQFTGQTDLNGKEIYEGDKDNHGNVVEFVCGSWCLNGDRPLYGSSFIVAGNIYENES